MCKICIRSTILKSPKRRDCKNVHAYLGLALLNFAIIFVAAVVIVVTFGGVLLEKRFVKIHRKTPVPESILKKRQVFSCEFCEIFKRTFFTEHLRVTAFVARNHIFQEKFSFNFHKFPRHVWGPVFMLPCITV